MTGNEGGLEKGLFRHQADDLIRCWWPQGDDSYIRYHDEEWGRPVSDDRRLFEKICLEGFQSGLSWLTILRKRDNFRKAFAGFDAEKIARFGDKEVRELLGNAGIVRHKGKILSVINNAQKLLEMLEKESSFAAYIWSFEPPADERPEAFNYKNLAALGKTKSSTRLSKDLKARGWSFVGPTTAYAFMQSMGMVNDHLEKCCMRDTIDKARAAFARPV